MRTSQLIKSKSGQALVEVALLTPFLLLLLLGVIEMGRYMYLGILVGNAARAGAAYGSQGTPQSVDTANICNAASYDFQGNATACSGTQSSGPRGTIAVTSSTSCGCDSGGSVVGADSAAGVYPIAVCSTDPSLGGNLNNGDCAALGYGGHWVVLVSVTASGTFNSLFNYPGIPSSIALSRTSRVRVAQ